MDEFKLLNKVGFYQGGNFHLLFTGLIDPIWNIFFFFFFDDIGKIIFLLYILHGNSFHFCMI